MTPFQRFWIIYQYLHNDGLKYFVNLPFSVVQPWIPAVRELAESIAKEGGATFDEYADLYHEIHGY